MLGFKLQYHGVFHSIIFILQKYVYYRFRLGETSLALVCEKTNASQSHTKASKCPKNMKIITFKKEIFDNSKFYVKHEQIWNYLHEYRSKFS